jgi:hypothetical protein
MAPLGVDPAALDGAGSAVVSVGEGLGSVISTLTSALSGCSGMAGNDPAGAALGRSYDNAASKLLEAMATTRNGLCRLGDGVRMSAHNYSLAEAMSDVSGRGEPLAVPPSTGSISAGSSPSAVGTGTSAPAGWGWVAPYIGMIWPDGDSAKLRAAAVAWFSAGTNFEVSEIVGGAGPMGAVGSQQIPEGPAIAAAFGDATRSAASILQQCMSIGAQLNAYAAKIDEVHAAILDLLARICDPMTGIKEVWDILTDKDEDEIKKIADDIRTVVNQFTSEVDALRHQIATAVSEATTIVTMMAKHADKEWDQFLHGTDVGRALNQVGQFGKGVGEEVGGLLKDSWTYGPMRAVVDPKGWYHSWKDMVGGMAPLVGLGGDHAPGVGESWKNLGKGITHWDEWKTNPAEAAGKSTFDIATLAAPGGPLSKAGNGLVDAAKGFRKPPVPAPRPPHVEPPKPTPPAVRESAPGTEPARPSRPAPAPEARPTPAPADSPVPHSPTQAKTPVAEKTPAGEAPTSPVSPGQHPASAPGMPGDRVPSTHPQPLEPAAARPPVPVDNPAEPAMAAAHSAPSAPAGSVPHLPMPDSSPPSAHPPPPPDGGFPSGHGGHQGPADGGGPHGPNEGVDPHESHPPGDGVGPHGPHPSSDGAGPHPPGDGTPPEQGTPHDGNGGSSDAPHVGGAGHGTGVPEPKVPGVDYPYAPSDALSALDHHPGGEVARLAEGGVPHKVLDRYDPLAGRTPEDFAREFAISDSDGKLRWDWDNQAPNNGFAGIPQESNHIPQDLRLDRIGPNGGGFMSPEGTPLAERATPPGLAAQYHLFESTGEPIPPDKDWVVLHGPAKDAFGQPGGGEQWVVIDRETGESVSVEELKRQGMIAELHK